MVKFYHLTGDALDAVKKLQAQLVARASRVLSPDEIVIRDLLPDDMGLTSGDFRTGSITTTATYSNQVSVTVANNRWIGIYGIGYGTTAVTQVRFSRGTSTVKIENIEEVQNTEDNLTFFTDPVIVDQQQNLTIAAEVASTTGNTSLQILGLVAEKRGVTINPC